VFTLLLADDPSPKLYAYAGASLGLAILTKPAAGFWAAPFLVWYVVLWLRKPALYSRMLLAGGLVLAIVSPSALRSIGTFGTPLAANAEAGYSLLSSRHDLPAFLTVLARNAALHAVAVPTRQWSERVGRATLRFQRWLGVDENDPAVIWPDSWFITEFSTHEDEGGNFLHFVLILAALLFILFGKHHVTSLRAYSACLVAGFLLFCFFLRWQPGHSRLHLPLFILFIPCIALAVEWYLPRWGRIALSGLLLIQIVPFLILNRARPLIGSHSILTTDRVSQMFINRPELQAPYELVTSALLTTDCRKVGLMAATDDWEYPLWVLTRARVSFEHAGVTNVTSHLGSPLPGFCAVVTTATGFDSVVLGGRAYKKVLNAPPLGLWEIDAGR